MLFPFFTKKIQKDMRLLLFIITILLSLLTQVSGQNQTVLGLVDSNSQLTILSSLIATVPQFKRSVASSLFTFFAPTDQAFRDFNATNPEDFAYITGNINVLLATLQCKLYTMNES